MHLPFIPAYGVWYPMHPLFVPPVSTVIIHSSLLHRDHANNLWPKGTGKVPNAPVKHKVGNGFMTNSIDMDKLRSKARLHAGGAVLENPIPMHAIFGWASDENDDKPRVPKCNYDIL